CWQDFMRLDSDNLIGNGVGAAHRFLGGRFSFLILTLIFFHLFFAVYEFGQRAPEEPLRLVDTLSLRKVKALDEPYRILSSCFVWTSFWQFAFTIFVLYLFGWFVLRRLGALVFLFTYFSSAAVTNLVTYELVSAEETVAGAGGGAIALSFLCAAYFPYLRFFGVVPAKFAAPVLICGGAFASAPHLGAVIVVSQLSGLSVAVLVLVFEPRFRMELSKWWLRRQVESAMTEAEEEEKLDMLLRKVSRGGMTVLSRKERNFLLQMSKKYNRRVTERKE
ncbi:MAG: rhomboid family intramembrane serine protease, partial [Planctomycetota bacterium]|nr:rhomboid family intramembrane serine protease [Planctomycetota bacterium]